MSREQVVAGAMGSDVLPAVTGVRMLLLLVAEGARRQSARQEGRGPQVRSRERVRETTTSVCAASMLVVREGVSMSDGRVSASRLLLGALVSGLIALGGCATCPTLPAGAALMIEVVHVEGGDAPVVEQLRVFDDGSVELKHSDGKRRCAKVRAALLGELRTRLASQDFLETAARLSEKERRCCDWEEVFVRVNGITFGVLVEEIPESLRAFFALIEAISREGFGNAGCLSSVAR